MNISRSNQSLKWKQKKQKDLIELMRKRIICLEAKRAAQIKRSAISSERQQVLQRVKERHRQQIQRIKSITRSNRAVVQRHEPFKFHQHLNIIQGRLNETRARRIREKLNVTQRIRKFKQEDLISKQNKRAEVVLQLQSSKSRISGYWEERRISFERNKEKQSRMTSRRMKSLEREVLLPFLNKEQQLRKSLSELKRSRLSFSNKQSLDTINNEQSSIL